MEKMRPMAAFSVDNSPTLMLNYLRTSIAMNGKSNRSQILREPGPPAESPGGSGLRKCVRERSIPYQAINESGTASDLPASYAFLV